MQHEEHSLNLRHREPVQEKFSQHSIPWKILIVDDESEVHTISRLILKDLVFDGHPIHLLNAYSAIQAKEILEQESNIALILLDVVMETESSGLELVNFVRNTLNNQSVRIILRTGHPGKAPESQVIFDYDINDYKSKNELTARKLVTATISALRAYRSLKNLEVSRRGLEMILESTDSLFEFSSLNQFAKGVLFQLTSFLSTEPAGILCLQVPPDNALDDLKFKEQINLIDDLQIIGDVGLLKLNPNQAINHQKQIIKDALMVAKRALQTQSTIFEHGLSAIYVSSAKSPPAVAVLYGVPELSEQDRFLLDIYISKISLALANIIHYNHYIAEKDAARTDVLTSLPNRRDYVDTGLKMFTEHQATHKPMVLAVMDLDGFKPINDQYGHDKGDLLLKEFAHFIKLSLKSTDYFARIGGDEFVLILPDTTQEQATKILERLLAEVCSHEFHLKGMDEVLGIGVSIGADASLTDGIDAMFKRADAKLYDSKDKGRNQLTI